MKNNLFIGRASMGAILGALALAFAPGMAQTAGAAQVAGVDATRGAINAAANPSGAQVRFSLASETAQSAQSPSKVTVSIGIFDETHALQSSADPALWSLYE